MFTRCALATFILLVLAPVALAGPGSGTASISPLSVAPAGISGSWQVIYTAEEVISNGRVEVTIPAGWPAPQMTGETLPAYVTVSTSSATGNPLLVINGHVIEVAVDVLDVGETITIVYGDDGGGLNPGAVVTAPTATGISEFTVASHPGGGTCVNILSSPTVEIVAAAPFKLAILGADTTTAGVYEQYWVVVQDEFNNPSPVTQNRTVGVFPTSGSFYLPPDQVTPITSFGISIGEDSVLVEYRATVATSGTPHTLTMFTTDALSPSLGGNTSVDVEPDVVSASVSTISATSSVVADGVAQSSVTVTSRDQYGNPRENDVVSIAADGSAVEIQPGNTGPDGTTSGALTNTTAETVTVEAVVDGQLLSSTASVTFTAGPVSAAASTVAATSPVTANGIDESTITVTARDANNNPVADQTVTLSIVPPGGGAVLQQPAGVTDANGEITGTLSSTTTGDRVVSATIGATLVTDDATVTFTPGPLASFEWVVDGASVAGDYEQPITLTALDAQGNVKTDYTGLVSLSTTTGGVGDLIDWGAVSAVNPVVDGVDDEATYQFAALDSGSVVLSIRNEFMETYRLIATDGVSDQSANIVNSHAAAFAITKIGGDLQTATVGANVAVAPRVLVEDEFGNPVDNETVTFDPLTPGSSADVVAGGAVQLTGQTNAAGELDCDVWTLATAAGEDTLRASINSGTIFEDFTATGAPDAGAAIDIFPPSQNITVSATDTVKVTLRDQYNNLVSGERVDVLIKDPSNGTLLNDASHPTNQVTSTSRWGLTNTGGQILVIYQAPATAGLSDNVDAFTTFVPQSSVTDAVYTTVASGATKLLIAFPSGNSANADVGIEFEVRAVDNNDNVDTGNNSTITLTPEGGSSLVFSELSDFSVLVGQVTLTSGTATVYTKTTKAGTWDITATGGGLTPDTEPVIIDDTGVIDHYAVSTVGSVAAGAIFQVDIEARDEFDNLVDGASNLVNLAAVLASDSTTLASDVLSVAQTTLVGGQASVDESYDTAESIRVRARDAGLKEGFSGTVVVGASAAKRIIYISGNSSSVVAGNAQLLTAEVHDENENPVAGASVTFTATGGGGSVPPGPVVTGADGRASTTLTTGTTVGANTVDATILGGNPPDEKITFTVNTIAGPLDYFTVVPAKTTVVANETIGVIVSAYDVNDNLRTQDNTTNVTLTSSTGNLQFTSSGGPLSGGVFSTTMFDNVAEDVFVTATAGGTSDDSPTITVNPGPAFEVIKASNDTTGVAVADTVDMKVLVRDAFTNPVSAAGVTFSATSVPGPVEFVDTVGDPGDGITSTDANGRATVRLVTANTPGQHLIKATIDDGVPPADETKTFDITTVSGGISYYTVVLDMSQQTAGQPVQVTVSAFDSQDNLVTSDNTTSVTLSKASGSGTPSFVTNPGTLTAGVFQTDMTINEADVYTIQATTTGFPTPNGTSDPVTIVPDVPSSLTAITGTAVPDTITANGLTTSDITSSVIRDQFNNPVAAGEPITISTDLGSFDSVDQDGGTPGNQQLTDINGRIAFRLRSEPTPGTATVTMASVNGDATGTVSVVFAPVPGFTCDDPPQPDVVFVGENAAFRVLVHSTSSTRADLNVSTKFEFSDGTHAYSANLAAPQSVAAGDTTTLYFVSAPVSLDQSPTFYQPKITFKGSDEFGASFSETCDLPAQSLLVSAVQITAINTSPVVSRGTVDTVRVSINNPTPSDVTINTVNPNFIPGTGNFVPQSSPDLPLLITAGNTGVVRVPVLIGAGTPTVTYQIDAFVSGTIGGKTVIDPDVSPFPRGSWTVQAGAALSYAAGSLTPDMVSQGQVHSFQVDVTNDGQSTVTLNAATTRLTFSGDSTYTATLDQATAIAGMMTETLTFNAERVPFMIPGPYAVEIQLDGVENSVPFVDTLSTADGGDQVTVETPASLSEPLNSLSPDVVSHGQSVAFIVTLNNTGGASIELDPDSTILSFDAFTATLDPAGGTTLAGLTPLKFVSTVIDGSIPTELHFPHIEVVGTENGLRFYEPGDLNDPVSVQAAANLQITNIIASQPSFTADQIKPIQVDMVVQNNGGSNVTFTTASLAFELGGVSKTNQFVISVPTQFVGGVTLAGNGGTDTVRFDVSDQIANAMSTGLMTIEGAIEVLEIISGDPVYSDPATSSKGSLLVQSPANLQLLSLIPEKTTVTQGMPQDFTIDLVIRNAGGSDLDLDLTKPNTQLNFTPSTGWNVTAGVLQGGGSVLSGGETDTLRFTVQDTGTDLGTAVIEATVQATESNSDVDRSQTGVSLASIDVQAQAVLAITDVTLSRTQQTNGASTPWEITVDLQNLGEADVDVVMPDSVKVIFGDATADPSYTIPSTLESGVTRLGQGEAGRFTIPVGGTGTYPSLGMRAVVVQVTGFEPNRGTNLSPDADFALVTIQAEPDLQYVTLVPDTVSRGTDVAFQVTVNNATAGGATAVLDRAQTQLRFDADAYAVQLAPSSPDQILGGSDTTLVFETSTVFADAPLGPQTDVQLELHWNDNGRDTTHTFAIPSTDLYVKDPPNLSIVSIASSKASVTQSLQSPWTIDMTVQNSGQTGVIIDMAQAATFLTLNLLEGGADVTGQYNIGQPTQLQTAQSDTLGGMQTDVLRFTISPLAGNSTGIVLISGQVQGRNVLNSDILTDNALGGSFEVQTPAAISIVSITPDRATATVGQTFEYDIEMVVENTGGADAALTLTKPSTDLSFTGSSGWVTTLQSQLDGGGTTLGGGETRTVRFTVNTTGGPDGPTTIDGVVSGVESNRGVAVSDSTSDGLGGDGSITLEQPANVQITSVVPSRSSVTQNTTVDWSITVTLQNTGGSAVQLDLPSGVVTSIANQGAPATQYNDVNALEEGGTILAGSGTTGTLVIPVTDTGGFLALGSQGITVEVGFTEINSGASDSVTDNTASITVQNPPILTYVASTLDPDTASADAVVQFRIDVTNNGADRATAVLDRGQTRLYFDGGSYSAFLDLTSDDQISGGETTTLVFEPKLLTSSPGDYPVTVDLFYDANDDPGLAQPAITDMLTVDFPPELSIVAIAASQPTVSAGMTAEWTVTMTLANTGLNGIDMDLSASVTNLTFSQPPVNDLPGYVVVQPDSLEGGGTVLGAGLTDDLVFKVTGTGFDTGSVVINGRAEGVDTGSIERVRDDTFSGGAGSVLVQLPPALVVTSITPSRTTVTTGQTTAWTADVVVENQGGATGQFNFGASSITFVGDNPNWTVGTPTGAATVSGGSSATLQFPVTKSGSAGTWPISAAVAATDANNPDTTVTGIGTELGSIIVQQPPALRLASTTIAAPNAPEVNTGQAFGVEVQVTNEGEAGATNVGLSLSHTGASTPTNPTPTIASVPAGSTVAYTFPVTAAGTPQNDVFTVDFTGALDANSSQPVPGGQFTRTDSTATAQIQAPSVFAIARVYPSTPFVTVGQPNPWEIIVVVQNTGTADVDITTPQSGDIAFSIGGSPALGYTVNPPTTFYDGGAGWTLAGNGTDSLRYTVVATGNTPGTVDIDATLGWTDVNDPTRTGSDTDRGSVVAQSPAGLYILSTESDAGVFNSPGPNRDIVNTGQVFDLLVTVQNTNEPVDSVSVAMSSDGASSIALVSPDSISIEVDDTGTFRFRVTADAQPINFETFTATIVYAESRTSGQPIDPEQAQDDDQNVEIQTRADLVVDLNIVSPDGALDGTVSKNQVFVVGAYVPNQGQADVTGPSELTLTIPGGFTLPDLDGTKTFTVDDTTFWNVQAPGAATPVAQDLTAAISTFPTDVNNNQPAFSSQSSDFVSVAVDSGGEFLDWTFAFESPVGAIDSVVSTSQSFSVRADVLLSDDIADGAATVGVPAGFTIVGSPTRNLGDGDGVTWSPPAIFDLIAPAGAVIDTIKVTLTGIDQNTTVQIPPLTVSLPVEVVQRTTLSVAADVTAPDDALDRTVTVGTPFTITANVSNAVGAAGITGTGELTISFEAGSDFQLVAGYQTTQPFSIGADVEWMVVAPPQPSGPDNIFIDIVQPAPPDENSGNPAVVAVGRETIAMVTEGAAVTIENITADLGIGAGVVPAGTGDIDLLGIEMKYENSDPTSADAELDTIAVTVLGASGTPLGGGTVGRTLSRVFVRLGPTQVYETTVTNTNPVIISFEGGGGERLIAPNDSVTVVIGVDVAGDPAVEEIRVQLRGDGVIIKDSVADTRLGVIDAASGQPLNGRLTSDPLVILSNQFEEYVHNYPNPFRAGSQVTRITYFMNAPGSVTMQIYAISGELVYEAPAQQVGPGPHELEWDGRNGQGEIVRNGIYVCVLNAGGNSAEFRIAVAK